jgi:hypothetical protein
MRILIFILISFLFSQSSVLSFGGFGSPRSYQNPINAGAGQIELFSTSSGAGSSSALATIWKSNFTNLNISNQFQKLNSSNYEDIFSNGIDLLSISFPIKENRALQISIHPQYWTQYSINELNNPQIVEFDGMNYSYKSHYYGRGGFSNLGLSWSQKLNDIFSFGIGLNNYFGNKFQSDSTFSYNISLNSEGEEVLIPNSLSITNSTHHYQGYGIRADLISKLDKYELGLSFKTIGPFTIEQKKYFSTGLSQSEIIKKRYNFLNHQAIFGIKYEKSPNLGFITELKYKRWETLDESFLILKTQNYNENQFSMGTYYHSINQSTGFFQSFTLRGGVYYKLLENLESDFIINDYGITFGTGFKYNNNANSINLSFVLGNRKMDIYEIKNEKYIDIILGIEVGEKWFLRKK